MLQPRVLAQVAGPSRPPIHHASKSPTVGFVRSSSGQGHTLSVRIPPLHSLTFTFYARISKQAHLCSRTSSKRSSQNWSPSDHCSILKTSHHIKQSRVPSSLNLGYPSTYLPPCTPYHGLLNTQKKHKAAHEPCIRSLPGTSNTNTQQSQSSNIGSTA